MSKTTITDNGYTHQTDPGKTKTNLNFPQRSFRYFLAILPIALVLLISTSYQRNPDDVNYFDKEYYSPEIIDSLRNFLMNGYGEEDDCITKFSHDFVVEFYVANDFKPVWVHVNGLSERASDLVYLIEHAREYGLEPQNYHSQELLRLIKKQEQNKLRGIEVFIDFNMERLLTDAAFRLMINMHAGYQPMDSALFASDWVKQLPGILMKGIASGKVFESLISVEPHFIEYTRLRKANELFIRSNHLTNYCAPIKFPNKDTVVLFGEIREALINLGYLDENIMESTSEALKVFQRYHGLNADGKPGMNTIEALEKSTLYRYRVLALNLDRLRKNHFTDSSLVYINIPAYRLKIFESNRLVDTLRVIVGNPATPTPVHSGNMERIIANPLWYVPKSIAINEMIPKIKSDSGYLQKNGFMILDKNYKLVNARSIDFNRIPENEFDYTFRQNRGTENSLGQVKFIFSNPYAIYLHDTPGKALFAKDLRAFSHGCIRVEHPDKLADYILNEINADTSRMSNMIASGQPREFTLASRLQVQITYITCEADENGKVYFYKDIYGNDKTELDALKPFMGI